MADITVIAEWGTVIGAAVSVGLAYVRRKYAKWGDEIISGMGKLYDGVHKLAGMFPEDKTLADFDADLAAAYKDAYKAWNDPNWMSWATLIKSSKDFYEVYEDMPAVIDDLVGKVKAAVKA